MRVRLKGLNRVTKKNATGKSVTYYYAWKGGPRLDGELGSPEFIASYNRAVEQRRAPRTDLLGSIFDTYQDSTEFENLAERTRKDYRRLLRIIGTEFGDFPVDALTDRRTRGEFLAWRQRLATKSRRQADYAFAVLALSLSWAYNRGLAPVNPCERPGRLYRAARNENVWTDANEKAFHASAPSHLRLALTLALWTGQRQGDLLRLKWAAYDGETIYLRQRKTKVSVAIPVGAPLKAALDTLKADYKREGKALPSTVLATERGTEWTESGFRASWRKACIKAGVTGVTFHDLRGTAVTRLAVSAATVPEIAAITGHSLKEVGTILDAHYMHRDPALGRAAIQKLEGRIISPN